jgi:hypothetical protein
MRPRWAPQSSKLSIPRVRDGRFDSDTFPRMRRFLVFTTALTVFLWAQSGKLFWDGYDWQRLEDLAREYPEFDMPLKRAHVRGLLDGKLYYLLQVRPIDPALADSVFRDYLDRFSIDELIRGTDQFYKNPEYRYLPVMAALTVTSLRAMDFPDTTVVAYINAMKEWTNRLTQWDPDQVRVPIEGISKPTFPRTPTELEGAPSGEEPHRWYFPDSLSLP